MKVLKFNNQELNIKIEDIYQTIKDNQENEAWVTDYVEPVEIDFTWYDNEYDEDDEDEVIRGYAIDFGDYHTALYTSIDEAQADFDLIQKMWKNKKIYVYYMNSSDDQPMEHINTLQGHANNKKILVNFAVHDINRIFEKNDWDSLCELISNVPKKNLRDLLSIERQEKLGLL